MGRTGRDQGWGPVCGGLVFPPGTGPLCDTGCRVGAGAGLDGAGLDGAGFDGAGFETGRVVEAGVADGRVADGSVAGAEGLATWVGGGVTPTGPGRVDRCTGRSDGVGDVDGAKGRATHPDTDTPRAPVASMQRCIGSCPRGCADWVRETCRSLIRS